MSTVRPNWLNIYGWKQYGAGDPQELVSVTRHTAELAMSALKDRMAIEYYHNHGAAHRELRDALTPLAPLP